MDLDKCPRCAWQSLETLTTHSYCINCNYHEIEDDDYDLYVEKLTPPPRSDFQVKQIEFLGDERLDAFPKKKIIFLVSDKKKKAA